MYPHTQSHNQRHTHIHLLTPGLLATSCRLRRRLRLRSLLLRLPALRHNGAQRIGAFNDFRHRRHSRRVNLHLLLITYGESSARTRVGQTWMCGGFPRPPASSDACGKCNLEFQLYLYFYEGLPHPLSPAYLPESTRKHYKSSVSHANFL